MGVAVSSAATRAAATTIITGGVAIVENYLPLLNIKVALKNGNTRYW